ncbi:MAG: hypothetical protein LUC24_00790, partial [Bacteroidales bacterium]|nr:hypothetical protein [Bacteroidales bacterium]
GIRLQLPFSHLHKIFYSAPENEPFPDFWAVEHYYVMSGGRYKGGDRGYFESLIDFGRYPGVPHELLLFMMHFWGKGAYGLKESIGSFYEFVDEYVSIPDLHFPKDKIPPEGLKD